MANMVISSPYALTSLLPVHETWYGRWLESGDGSWIETGRRREATS